jgi:hypothetical protein
MVFMGFMKGVVMQELFKRWASESKTFKEFNKKFSWWLIFQEVNPDNCYSEEELKRYHEKYKA